MDVEVFEAVDYGYWLVGWLLMSLGWFVGWLCRASRLGASLSGDDEVSTIHVKLEMKCDVWPKWDRPHDSCWQVISWCPTANQADE